MFQLVINLEAFFTDASFQALQSDASFHTFPRFSTQSGFVIVVWRQITFGQEMLFKIAYQVAIQRNHLHFFLFMARNR